jgi:hypothetical protein
LPEGLLRAPPVHRLALGGGGAAPDRRALPDRGRGPRPPGRGAAAVRQERSKPIVEALARLAHGPAGAGLRALHPGGGDPLRPAALGRAGPLPRGWPARARHQHGGEGDPADRPGPKE